MCPGSQPAVLVGVLSVQRPNSPDHRKLGKTGEVSVDQSLTVNDVSNSLAPADREWVTEPDGLPVGGDCIDTDAPSTDNHCHWSYVGAAASPRLGPGTQLDGRYLLSELIGQGSSAAVYRGTDTRLGRSVAVKVFYPPATDLTMLARQRTEIRFLATLNHPNLVAIYDARVVAGREGLGDPTTGFDGPVPSYLVMEFVAGRTLADRLASTPVGLDETVEIGSAVANSLAFVHGNGVVHRDVKPANILLPREGGAKLTDFGIARLVNTAHLTNAAEVVGTPLYLSPEQAQGVEVETSSDIYSLGLVLLECLTGNPEFPGAAVQSVMARLFRNPHVPVALPEPLADLLRAMTSPAPEERPTADAVATVLADYLKDRYRSRTATTITAAAAPLPRQAHPAAKGLLDPVPMAPGPSVRRRRVLPVVTSGFALAVMTAVIAWTSFDRGDHPADPATTESATTESATRVVGTRSASTEITAATTSAPATNAVAREPPLRVTATITQIAITTETATTTDTATTTESPTTTTESPTTTTEPVTTSTDPVTTTTEPVTTTTEPQTTTSNQITTDPDRDPATIPIGPVG